MSFRYVWNKYNRDKSYSKKKSSGGSIGTNTPVYAGSSYSFSSSNGKFSLSGGHIVNGLDAGPYFIVGGTSGSTMYYNAGSGYVYATGDGTGNKYWDTWTDPYTFTARTNYSRGSLIGPISAAKSNQYPSNNYSGSYWYVYQGSDTIDPTAVTIPESIRGDSDITIEVSPSKEKKFGGTVSYTYQYKFDGGEWVALGTSSNLTQILHIPYGTQHVTARVQAKDNLGFTSDTWIESSIVAVTNNEPPTAPGSINVSGVVSGGTATITLTEATDPDGTIENYIYERSVDGGDFVQFAKVNSLTQTDTISEEWGTVAYRACAVDNAGAVGPYVTGETETINSGWVLIGGPVSNLGVKSEQFDFKATIGVSGETGITDIAVVAKLDGNQVYDDLVDQNEVVTIPIDTRTFGEGQHELQVIASKEDLLSAAAVYVFTVPSIALPSGGYAMQFEDEYGNPIFPVGSARFILGENGMSVQAEVNMLRNAHRGLTGHLFFMDALLGPTTKEYDRQANVTYAMQHYDPVNGSNPGGLLCINPTFNGTLSTLLSATASKLSFTVPTNTIISLYKYVLDILPDVSPDLTVNFIALAQPRVLSAATNAGNASTDLQDALKQIMAAFSTWNYYAILDPESATTYYVASQAEITDDTPNASNVAYVSSAKPNKWYQGVSMTFFNQDWAPSKESLTLGNTISWAGQNWIVANVDSTECYLTLANIYSQTPFAPGVAIYADSDLANTAMSFQTQQLTVAQLACLKDVTVNDVAAKVFVASKEQMDGGFSYFSSNSSRNLGGNYWTSTPFDSEYAWFIGSDGGVYYSGGAALVSTSNGFRPSVCLDLTLLG